MSPGEQLIDLVYIDDVIDAFMVASERLLTGKVNYYEDYAVSSGNPIRLRELVKLCEDLIGKKLPIQWGRRAYRTREVMSPWNRGKQIPGWEIKTGLIEGIRKTFQCSLLKEDSSE